MTWEELLEMVDMVEYVSQYVDLEYKNGEYWGMSPFQEENTPSFSIRQEAQLFNDFSSGKSGNIYNFIMEYNHVDFPQAIKILKDYLNVVDEGEYIPKPQIIKVLKQLTKQDKKEKVIERKILPSNYMNKYQKVDIKLWQEEGILQEVMDRYNVRYEPIKQVIVFPVWDNQGNIINVKGRNIGKSWKEIGLPKYFYYYKLGTIDFLWGLHLKEEIIKKKKEIILVESEKSVMKLEGWGYDNAVALCNGKITDEQMKILIKLGVNVVIALDKDKGNVCDTNTKTLKRYAKVYKVYDKFGLLSAKDAPCDRGIDVWEQLYNNKRLL